MKEGYVQLRFAKTPICSLLSFKTYYFATHHVIHVTVELWPMDLVLIRDKSSNLSTNSIDLHRLHSQTNGIIKYIGPKLDIQMIPW